MPDSFLQGSKTFDCGSFTPGLKPRPPKEKALFRRLISWQVQMAAGPNRCLRPGLLDGNRKNRQGRLGGI